MWKMVTWPILSWACRFTSSIYSFVTWPLERIYFISSSRKATQGDEEQLPVSVRPTISFHLQGSDGIFLPLQANCPSLMDKSVPEQAVAEFQSSRQLLIISIFAEVYLLDRKTIRKVPRGESDDDMQPILREAMIYDIVGAHPRIAECLSRGSDDVEYIDIRYYPHGDLASYCQKCGTTPALRSKWFQQILEAIVVIHSFNVIHSDLALRQFFVDDNLDLRLGDFNSSQCPGYPALGYEKASHCLPRDYELPNTEASDIFALGSTLYELVVGRAPYGELNVAESDDPDSIKAQIRRQHAVVDFEIEERYKKLQFPDVRDVQRGDIILGCWKGQFASAKEVLDRYLKL